MENIGLKARRAKLHWYGNILQMGEGDKVKTMKKEVGGTRAKGRPRTRWMNNIGHDMNKMEVRGTRAKGRPTTRWLDNIGHDMNKTV